MKKQSASLDTSFWIDAYRAGILEKVFKVFNIFVTQEVYQETSKPIYEEIKSDDAELFERKVRKKKISLEKTKRTIQFFGKGEASCLSLAKEKGFVILIDDYKVYSWAKKNLQVKVLSTLDFLFLLFKKGKITKKQLIGYLKKLPGVSPKEKEKLILKLKKGGRR